MRWMGGHVSLVREVKSFITSYVLELRMSMIPRYFPF